VKCPGCRHENSPGAKFCDECGAALKRRCASCGAELRSTAKFCDECGASVSVPAAPPAGERRQLTVLFCDLVGSTPLSQRLDAERGDR
jgi:class 3 adenylate cyclase